MYHFFINFDPSTLNSNMNSAFCFLPSVLSIILLVMLRLQISVFFSNISNKVSFFYILSLKYLFINELYFKNFTSFFFEPKFIAFKIKDVPLCRNLKKAF